MPYRPRVRKRIIVKLYLPIRARRVIIDTCMSRWSDVYHHADVHSRIRIDIKRSMGVCERVDTNGASSMVPYEVTRTLRETPHAASCVMLEYIPCGVIQAYK